MTKTIDILMVQNFIKYLMKSNSKFINQWNPVQKSLLSSLSSLSAIVRYIPNENIIAAKPIIMYSNVDI